MKNRKTFFYIVQPRTKDARVIRIMQKSGQAHCPICIGLAPLPHFDKSHDTFGDVLTWLIDTGEIKPSDYANCRVNVEAI